MECLEEKKQKFVINFSEKNLTLLGWKIIESPNKEIIVKITDIKKATKEQLLKKDTFNFTEKMKETGVAYYGPYKREVKKIQNNGKLD